MSQYITYCIFRRTNHICLFTFYQSSCVCVCTQFRNIEKDLRKRGIYALGVQSVSMIKYVSTTDGVVCSESESSFLFLFLYI